MGAILGKDTLASKYSTQQVTGNHMHLKQKENTAAENEEKKVHIDSECSKY